MYRLGIPVLGSSGHAGVAVGIARRALEEIASIAAGKVRGEMPCVADQPLFQHAFASHEAAFQAARTLTWDVFGRAQAMVESGQELSEVDVQRVRQTVTYITGVTADIVNFCYTWSGSAGLRNPSALGRCLRDIYACTQHKYVDQNTLVDAGRSLLASWQTARHTPADEPTRPNP
jgi:alkylation response protein AidB-like acyl-CoA dehydrogenase